MEAELDTERLIKSVASLTHIHGRLRPKATNRREIPYSQQSDPNREAATWLPKGFVELPRFEMPMNLHVLTDLTPIQYLTRYCVIASRVRKLLYHRQYAKYRDPKGDGIDSLEKLKKALKDICTFTISAKSFSPSDGSLNYYLHGILGFDLEDSVRITFKTFMGVAALAERIFSPSYMESWWDNEKRLEADYLLYRKLREQEAALKSKTEERELEETHQQYLKTVEMAKASARKKSTLRSEYYSEVDSELLPTKLSFHLDPTTSEELLVEEVAENRRKLENKISITKMLEIERRPNKCPKELMEQIDFHAVKWKLKDVNISLAMQRLVSIIVNL